MMGRQVKTLINQTKNAGYKSVIWDATNDYGKPAECRDLPVRDPNKRVYPDPQNAFVKIDSFLI